MAFQEIKDIDAIIKVLETVTHQKNLNKDEKTLKRCWFQLGLCYDLKKQFTESVNCFQNLIRLDDQDLKAWQCLAEAYFKRGSYINALKSFIKAIQLRDTLNSNIEFKFYEELRVAKIKTLLNCFSEASKIYSDILSLEPDSIVCLLGLAEVKLLIANEKFSKNMPKEAFALCSEVLTNASKASKLRPDLVLPYNISSNCCLLCLKNFPSSNSVIQLRNFDLNKQQLCEFGIKFTQKALYLKNFSYLWFNLSIFYLLMFFISKEICWLKKSIYSLVRSQAK